MRGRGLKYVPECTVLDISRTHEIRSPEKNGERTKGIGLVTISMLGNVFLLVYTLLAFSAACSAWEEQSRVKGESSENIGLYLCRLSS